MDKNNEPDLLDWPRGILMLQAMTWIGYAILYSLPRSWAEKFMFYILFAVWFTVAGWFFALATVCFRLLYVRDKAGWVTLIWVLAAGVIGVLLCMYAMAPFMAGVA